MATVPKRVFTTNRGRKWLHGIGLAVLPLLVGYGILTDETAVLWAALIGAVVFPGIAVKDAVEQPAEQKKAYLEGYDEGQDTVMEPGTGKRKREL